MVVKYLGAAYLTYLGIKTLIARPEANQVTAQAPRSLRRIFVQGLLVEVLNPKTALFFLAFLLQFVDPSRGSVAAQTLLLGVILATVGLVSDSVYALIAGAAGSVLRRGTLFPRLQRYISGRVYLGLGATTALMGSRE